MLKYITSPFLQNWVVESIVIDSNQNGHLVFQIEIVHLQLEVDHVQNFVFDRRLWRAVITG
jgi:hypothetical protein